MTNTDTAATVPATAALTDEQLTEILTRYAAQAEKTIADVRAKLAAPDSSVLYAAQWHVGDAVRAEATLRIYRTALTAAAKGQMRVALADGIAQAMSVDGHSTDPWANAVADETRTAGRRALSMFGSEIDTAAFLSRLA